MEIEGLAEQGMFAVKDELDAFYAGLDLSIPGFSLTSGKVVGQLQLPPNILLFTLA